MPFVAAPDGVEVYYQTEGGGFPIVFTHGNMVSVTNSPCRRAFYEPSTAVFCMIFVGAAFLGSPKPRYMIRESILLTFIPSC